MASENTIIIDVETNAAEAAQGLARTKEEIAALKAEQKELQRVIAAGADTTGELSARYADNAAQLKLLAAEEKMYTAQLNITTDGNREYGDSLVELSAKLAAMKAEYRGLTAGQREAAGGQELKRQIQELDATLKQADGSLGDFHRNVGNYQSALAGLPAPVTKLITLFQGGFKNGLQAAGQAVKAFGKTLLTTPVGWMAAAAAALVAVFKQLQAAFKRNDDAGTALSASMARLQPVITGVRKVFDGLATAVAAVVGGITKAASAVAGLLVPSFREASKAAEEAVLEQDRLEEARRVYSENEAKRARDVAQLNKQARSDSSLTARQREEIYKRIDAIEREGLEEKRRIAKREYELQVQRARQTRDTSDKMKDAIVEARNKMLAAETEYLNGTTRIAQRQRQAAEEAEREEQARQEAARQRWQEQLQKRKEAAEKEAELMRQLEDMQVAAIKDAQRRAEAELALSYSRQIADLRKMLDEEANLTAAARAAINAQMVRLQEQQAQKMQELRDNATREAIARENAAQEAIVDAQIAAMAEGVEKSVAIERERTDREVAALRARLEQEKSLTLSEQAAIHAQVERLQRESGERLEAIRREAAEKAAKSLYEDTLLKAENILNERLLQAGDNVREQADLQLEAARQRLDALLGMDATTKAALFESEEQYKSAVLAAEAEIRGAQSQTGEALRQQAQEVAQTMQAVTGALSDLFEAAAGDSEAYAKFKKAMAIVDATISLAQTIAAATAVSTEGDPYTMAVRIAANVAAVTAQFAAVIKAIKAAAIPSAPAFEKGGIVPGNSYTGDNVLIRANSGESVLTREMTSNLLQMLAEGVPLQRIDYARLGAAVADAVREMPAPVLEYAEFKAFERGVAMSEGKLFNQ